MCFSMVYGKYICRHSKFILRVLEQTSNVKTARLLRKEDFGHKQTYWCQLLKNDLIHYKVILASEEVIAATLKASQPQQK